MCVYMYIYIYRYTYVYTYTPVLSYRLHTKVPDIIATCNVSVEYNLSFISYI